MSAIHGWRTRLSPLDLRLGLFLFIASAPLLLPAAAFYTETHPDVPEGFEYAHRYATHSHFALVAELIAFVIGVGLLAHRRWPRSTTLRSAAILFASAGACTFALGWSVITSILMWQVTFDRQLCGEDELTLLVLIGVSVAGYFWAAFGAARQPRYFPWLLPAATIFLGVAVHFVRITLPGGDGLAAGYCTN